MPVGRITATLIFAELWKACYSSANCHLMQYEFAKKFLEK
jgi:hypothetical protein